MAFDQFEEARRMLVRAVAEIKGGQFPTARRYLERLVTLPSTGDQKAEAYFWLSEIAESDAEKRDFLQSALGYDMTNYRARKSLAILDGRLKPEEIINPDEFKPAVPARAERSEGRRFECPTCGATMVFSPDGQSLVCEHCDRRIEDSVSAKLAEQDFLLGALTAKGHQQARATQSFECKACGSVFLLAPEILSITCPHCDSTYTLLNAETRELIPPEGVIPMAIDQHQAESAIRNRYAKGGKDLQNFRIESLIGIYLPAWTFDLDGNLKWTGYIEYQEDQLVPVQDYGVIHFDDLFIPASKPEPRYLMKLLGKLRASDVLAFKPEYLANWLAESYQVTMADAAVTARAVALKQAQQQQFQKAGLSRVQNLRFYSDEMLVESYKLVLVPVWIARLQVESVPLEALVNGKTGEVYGDKPPGLVKQALDWLQGK